MDHIAGALRDLGSSAPPGSLSLVSAGAMPQSQSDQVLRNAVVPLRLAETSLSGNTERHHRARIAVSQAIRELETALRIR